MCNTESVLHGNNCNLIEIQTLQKLTEIFSDRFMIGWLYNRQNKTSILNL